jgi:glutamate synthase (NADPH/NADH) large chain
VDVAHSLTQNDEQLLRRLIARHVRYTDSPRGKLILSGWDSYRGKFVKVMPIEYRRALQQIQARSRVAERPEVSVAVGD